MGSAESEECLEALGLYVARHAFAFPGQDVPVGCECRPRERGELFLKGRVAGCVGARVVVGEAENDVIVGRRLADEARGAKAHASLARIEQLTHIVVAEALGLSLAAGERDLHLHRAGGGDGIEVVKAAFAEEGG